MSLFEPSTSVLGLLKRTGWELDCLACSWRGKAREMDVGIGLVCRVTRRPYKDMSEVQLTMIYTCPACGAEDCGHGHEVTWS